MKTSLLFALALTFCMASSCYNPENEYESKGTITKRDYTKCMCCGGWFIEIDGKEYRFLNMPESSGINLDNETLPLDIWLDWTTGACLDISISIDRAEKVK